MKLRFLTLFFFLFTALAFCQSEQKTGFPAESDKEFDKGSGITQITLDQPQIQKLKKVGLIWGFLKYHHPAIAKGNYNWDYELFRMLPYVLSAKNEAETDALLLTTISRLGEVKEGKTENLPAENIKVRPDLDWIGELSTGLKTALLKIKDAGRSEEHYYVGLFPNVGNPEFKHEDPYYDMLYPDAGFRLLSLYRYWNIIQYYFPYKYLIEEDWKGVLEEYIPKINEAKNETEYNLVVLELIARVHDTHANIWGEKPALDKYFGEHYAGVELTFAEDKAIVTGFYETKENSGLQLGDLITAINNKQVEEIIKEKLKVTPASNYPTQLRDIARDLLRTNDSLITVNYSRGNQHSTKVLKTYLPQHINMYSKYFVKDTCFKAINKDIAYINNGSIKKKYLPELWGHIKDTKGLIIDIRNYPSDFVIYELSNYLMPERKPFVKFSNGSLETPGLFTFTQDLIAGKQNKDYYKGKVVIIINETTQSSAEFHSMAYRVAPRATVIGSTTAAADGNVSQFYLPGGIPTMITGIGVYYPDGRETQRVGIVPDVVVKPTIAGIKAGKDELLEKAVEVINRE